MKLKVTKKVKEYNKNKIVRIANCVSSKDMEGKERESGKDKISSKGRL